MTAVLWNISTGQLGVAAWLCSLQLPHTSSLAEHKTLEKVLDFLATTEHQCYHHSSHTKSKQQLLGGKLTLSQPKAGHGSISVPASGFARSPTAQQLLRVHAPCLGCARGCWRRWVTVGAPLHPPGKAHSPPCSPSALAELFQKIAFLRRRALLQGALLVDVPRPLPCCRRDPRGSSRGRGRWEGAGDTRASPSLSCRCPLVETGKISEKTGWCRAGCGGLKPTRGSRARGWALPPALRPAQPSGLLPERLFHCRY